jgi:RNase H-fold protein (predicted Holliday junction resolvase)
MILGIDVGQKNLGVCVWDGTHVTKWAVWNSTGSWAPEIFQALVEHATNEFLDGVTQVVIERQPSKNPSMTRIMHYLEFFFVSRGLPVYLQDSKHKLLYASTTPWFPKECTDAEWNYRYRKKLAVQTAQNFVETTKQPLAHIFETSKKKDDLADSLFHAMAYAAFKKVTPSADTRKPPAVKKVVARAPTDKQRRTGKLSASNVKYLLKNVSEDDIPQSLKKDPQLGRALKRHFGSVADYLSRISNRADPGRGADNP